jgi:hypothetical protein
LKYPVHVDSLWNVLNVVIDFCCDSFPNQTILLLIPFPNKNKPVKLGRAQCFVGFTSLIFATFSTGARRKIVLRVTCFISGLPSLLKGYFFIPAFLPLFLFLVRSDNKLFSGNPFCVSLAVRRFF